MPEKQPPRTDTIRESLGSPSAVNPAVESPVAPDPFIGKHIGNCRLLERLNEGGTAFIYRAHNIRFDLERVVKILKPSLVGEEDFFLRFKQEAQLVARFDHPNIMRVFDTGEVGGYFYIETEYIHGQTLREYISRNPRINEREILSIAGQIVSALDYAHNVTFYGPNNEEVKGILHRDIKPENIMIMPGKLIKLMDFGAARPLNISSHTMQGMIVGTFHYMSPEQISGVKLDRRSDFFSLGIVLYEMATGQKPFSAENLTELINAIKETSYTRVRKLRPSISPLTEELIDRLLSRNPDHRPSGAKEISESLKVCLNSYLSYGTSPKVAIPFSIKRHFATIALVFSVIALSMASFSFWRTLHLQTNVPTFNDSASLPLLEQGKQHEQRKQWNDAIDAYKLVPSIEKGGLANEYLEAQIRMAAIMIKYQGQYIKARKILEELRTSFSDPAVDAFLGRAYFHLGLYLEARDRFDNALKATAGSVIPQTREFKREILYYSAWTIDKQFEGEPTNAALLIEALKAWNYYVEFSHCSKKRPDEECSFAFKRRVELNKLSTTME
ncbi:MAG: protein kinase [Chitinispirillaceae bacterium]|nr:protein kinase [Chitinispirillaceae bacterium]